MSDSTNTQNRFAQGGKTVYGASVGILMLDTVFHEYPETSAMPPPGRFQ